MIKFGSNLKKYREISNLTQEELASEINHIYNYPLTKTTISQLENKRIEPNIELLKYLSEYFSVTMEIFTFGEFDKDGDFLNSLKYKILEMTFDITNTQDLDILYNYYYYLKKNYKI